MTARAPLHVLTFDLEDWFNLLAVPSVQGPEQWQHLPSRFEAGVDRLLEVVLRCRRKATFFCVGWMAQRFPQAIRRIADAGFEVGSHSHEHQLVHSQDSRTFGADLRRSLDAIAQVTGQRVRLYRAPGFSVSRATPWAFEQLAAAGIEVDCSVFPARLGDAGFPDAPLTAPGVLETASGALREFPMSTWTLGPLRVAYSGGGYFRLYPYWLVRALVARSEYTMTYFHPRDFDPEQPVVTGLGPVRRFKSYVGLARAAAKLERLLTDFPFTDVRDAEARIDWASAPRFVLRP